MRRRRGISGYVSVNVEIDDVIDQLDTDDIAGLLADACGGDASEAFAALEKACRGNGDATGGVWQEIADALDRGDMDRIRLIVVRETTAPPSLAEYEKIRLGVHPLFRLPASEA